MSETCCQVHGGFSTQKKKYMVTLTGDCKIGNHKNKGAECTYYNLLHKSY